MTGVKESYLIHSQSLPVLSTTKVLPDLPSCQTGLLGLPSIKYIDRAFGVFFFRLRPALIKFGFHEDGLTLEFFEKLHKNSLLMRVKEFLRFLESVNFPQNVNRKQVLKHSQNWDTTLKIKDIYISLKVFLLVIEISTWIIERKFCDDEWHDLIDKLMWELSFLIKDIVLLFDSQFEEYVSGKNIHFFADYFVEIIRKKVQIEELLKFVLQQNSRDFFVQKKCFLPKRFYFFFIPRN